ncbi:protein translocase subunit SecF [Insolitispirillum peregrinum]|uniref:protein translocase subunit SecF n=1 Tax=Insolitispirillum peregrinum TaxID=80876 RepID=UPI0036237055
MISLLKFLPQEFKIDFMRRRWIGFIFSAALTLASLVSIAVQGFNFGIDFSGGVLIEAEVPEGVHVSDIRAKVSSLDLGEVAVTTLGESGREVSLRLGQPKDSDEKSEMRAVAKIKEVLGEGYTYKRVDVVGPKVGGELIQDGVYAILGAMAIIGIYIWIRFEWQYSIGAMLGLIHDVITAAGIFSLFQIEFDLTVVAALLTVAGYSINDTVVQFDRVRENLRRYKKMELYDLLNRSLNEVFTRTLLTSFTTFLAAASLLAFGGDVLRGFSLAVTWGVIAGTYSSFYMALPTLLYTGLRRDDSEDAEVAKTDAMP